MAKIMVIGVSAGAGKSTFARKLGEKMNVAVSHLDALYWKPGWVEAPVEEFIAAQQAVINRESWIIEGNYNSTFELRAEKCDIVIYLELPLYVCLYRVVKRRIINHGKTRPDMTAGCKEKIDKEFIMFILKTYYSRKTEMARRLEQFRTEGKKVITLKSNREIEAFWQGIENYKARL